MAPHNAIITDSRVVNALFASLRTCIPEDALLRLLSDSGDEIKFLIAVQPRVSSFSLRRRHSLRHPALSMATKRFFVAHKRLYTIYDGGNDRPRQGALHHDSPVSALLAEYMREDGRTKRHNRIETEEELWNEFAMSVSSSLNQFLHSSCVELSTRGTNSPKMYPDYSVAKGANYLVTAAEESENKKNGSRSRKRKEINLKSKIQRRKKLEEEIKVEAVKLLAYDQDDDEEEEITKLQDREDFCWAQVARCYDMVLKCASVPCRMAAMSSAVDGLLNDVIRRFWDRITVAPTDKAYANDEGLDVERLDGDSEVENKSPKLPDGTPKKTKKTKKGRRNSKKDAGVAAARSTTPEKYHKARKQYAGTALYMTSLQYVYLNTRIASALLPKKKELEIEMLQSVQEDLIVDSMYDESDPSQELYFGKAPRLIVPEGVMVDKNPNPRRGSAVRPRYNAMPSGWGVDDGESLGHYSMAVVPGGDASVQNSFWNSSRLPSLTYAQFWYSMLTLADNWTTSASNPVENALFLLELYSEIFAQDWDNDDETLLKQFQHSYGEYIETGEEIRERIREATAMLKTFNEMVEEMEDWDSSDSDFMDRINRVTEGYAPVGGFEDQQQKKKLTSQAFYEMLEADDTIIGNWKYITRVGKDGKIQRLRVKEILIRSKASKKKAKEKAKKMRGEDGGEYDEDEEDDDDDDDEFSQYTSSGSEYSVYILEEELNSDGEVVARRRRHKHRLPGESYEDYLRPIRFDESSSDDEFMYAVVEAGMGAEKQRYLKRYLYDKPAKQLRRIEGPDGPRWDDYGYAVDENLSDTDSWSSYSSGRNSGSDENEWRSEYKPLTTEAERQSRVRHRVRRTGKRTERRRYGRKPNYYYKQEGYDMYSFSTYSLTLDDLDEVGSNRFSKSKSKSSLEGKDASFGAKAGAEGGDAAAAAEDEALPDKLTEEQRAYLRERKSFLQKMMALKGITISDEAFAKESEEIVLWQLLQLAQKHQQKVEAGEAKEEDFGVANFDAALLAKIFTNPEVFSLDDLQRSELMRLLLEDEDGPGMALLSAAQMAGVLAALQLKPKNRLELPSERLRRERLMAKAREMHKEQKRIEKEKRRAEREAEKEAKLAELRAAKEALKKDDIFALTETGDEKQRERMPSFGTEESNDLPTPTLQATKLSGIPKKKPPSPKRELAPSSSGSYHMDQLTKEERRRQDKLFREFEKYAAQQASMGGRYKVVISTYSLEQIDEFINHLHLGPKDRALLKGRAPLGQQSSTMGGTMHQLSYGKLTNYGFNLDGVVKTVRNKEPMRLAPMKLYTLTTESSLKKALWETYRQYVDDREYISNTTNRLEATRPSAGLPSRRAPHTSPSSKQGSSSLPSYNKRHANSQTQLSSGGRQKRSNKNRFVESDDDYEDDQLAFLTSPPPVQLAYEEPMMELSNSRGLDDFDDDVDM